MPVQYSKELQDLDKYLELEMSIINHLREQPIEAYKRCLSVSINLVAHLKALKLDKPQKPSQLPLSTQILMIKFNELCKPFDTSSIEEEPEVAFLIAQEKKLDQENFAERIDANILQRSEKQLESMPKLKEMPSRLTSEQQKMFLGLLNAGLINVTLLYESNPTLAFEVTLRALSRVTQQEQALELNLSHEKGLDARFLLLKMNYEALLPLVDSAQVKALKLKYPHEFEHTLPLLTPQEIRQASLIYFNKEQVEIIKKLKASLKEQGSFLQKDGLLPIQDALKTFIKTHDLEGFRKAVNNTLRKSMHTLTAQSKPTLYKAVYNAFVYLLRAFFRVFDYVVTTITFKEKLMRDTETPFAKRVTGKSHFFTYYDDPIPAQTQEKTSLNTLELEFNQAIQQFQKANDEGHQHVIGMHA